MDYKFIFEDGSVALAHHGTKGMKWGVWNAETRARYSGSRTIGGSPAQVAYGNSYGKAKSTVDSFYDKRNKAHRHDVSLFRDAAKNDAKAAKKASKLYPKGSTEQKQWEKIRWQSLGESAAMNAWLNEPVNTSSVKKGRRKIEAALPSSRAAALAISGGSNPFLFG